MLKFLILAFSLLSFNACQTHNPESINLIPLPQEITIQNGFLDLSEGLNIEIQSKELLPLKSIIEEDFKLLSKEKVQSNAINFSLKIDTTMNKGCYKLDIGNRINLTGSNYEAVVNGVMTLWQSMQDDQMISKCLIQDCPKYSYRSIMLDVARAYHSVETIKTIIDLCRWYKINYLHLHLTDDSAFTFPSTTYPQLTTENHAYTKSELVDLNKYAFERGVTLIPELDVPGHASQFIHKMPDLFGIEDPSKSPYTISMAREETYEALNILIKEIVQVFTQSPYIHIGGDEAFFEGMKDDATTLAYMKKHDLTDLNELFRHFLVRLNEFVRQQDKHTIVWAGFGEHGTLEIPNDIIVMNWNHIYHDPVDLVENNYPIINASFKPLYVVNNRKWAAQYIYNQWNPNRWESWENEGDFNGLELEPNNQVLGATMCAWEQNQINQMPRLRHRVASMSQHLWSNDLPAWETFKSNQNKLDEKLQRLIQVFDVETEGLTYPKIEEGNFYEHLYFPKELKINVKSGFKDLHYQYALNRKPTETDWKNMDTTIVLKESSSVHIRALNTLDKQIGRTYHQAFYHKPITAKSTGLSKALPLGSWEKWRFEDTAWIKLKTENEGYTLRYKTNNEKLDSTSPIYEKPLPITETTHFSAQLFDANNNPFGSSYNQTYYKIWNEVSLTTGKPITASNDHILPNAAVPANNGRITLWEMWGDHKTNENWIKVDLEKIETINKFKVYTFWDSWRYYQYTIEGSLDGDTWFSLVDFSENREIATSKGIEHSIEPSEARYLKLNVLFNSANPGLHVVEFQAF